MMETTANQSLALLASVRRLRQGAEADFVRAGESLISAQTGFEAVEAAVASVEALSVSEAADRLAAAVAQMQDGCRRSVAEMEAAFGPLRTVSDILADLGAVVGGMSALVRTLKVIAINARIIAATIADASDLFAFVQGVRDAGSRIDAVLARTQSALASLKHDGSTLSALGTELETILQRDTGAALAGLATWLGEFTDLLAHVTASGGRLAQRSASLRDAVASAIGALQAGDALRQRLEHVELILVHAADPVRSGPTAAALLRLAQLQLEDALNLHQPHVAVALKALQDACNTTVQFVADVGGLVPKHASGDDRRDPVRALRATLERGAASHAALEQQARDMSRHMEEILASVEEFARLGENVRYIGMNAVIACDGLGADGRPLRVIAQQLRSLATDAVETQRKMREGAEGLQAHMRRLSDGLANGTATLQDVVSKGARSIDLGYGELNARLDAGAKVFDEDGSGLERTVAEGARALAAHLAAVGEVEAACGRVVMDDVDLTDLDADGQAIAAKVRAALTVEREREVHDGWLATVRGSPVRTPSAHTAAQSLDSIFF